MHRDDFLKQLVLADVLIGNSSCGIIEAPSAGTPSVNIGPRQFGRKIGGSSVIHAEPTQACILAAIARALGKRPIKQRSQCYGNGTAGRKVANILRTIDLGEQFRRKKIEF